MPVFDVVDDLRSLAVQFKRDECHCDVDTVTEAADLIEKLPLTADGVRMYLGMIVWERIAIVRPNVTGDELRSRSVRVRVLREGDKYMTYYSTQTRAEGRTDAAREQLDG